MIGNDIIDLALAKIESNWKRKGWLEKIYTKTEQTAIADAENPEILVWVLWSMKEAAYKIYNRQTKIRAYIPLRLECSAPEPSAGFLKGIVKVDDMVYYTKTTLNEKFIHTIAVNKSSLLKTVRACFENNIPFQKDQYGIPFLIDNITSETKLLSISHHGRFYVQVFL